MLDPGSAEDGDQGGEVLQGCVADGEDWIFDEANADGVDLFDVEVLTELLCEQGELFNYGLFGAPVLVRTQLYQAWNDRLL